MSYGDLTSPRRQRSSPYWTNKYYHDTEAQQHCLAIRTYYDIVLRTSYDIIGHQTATVRATL
jgi:hypothetical protein